MKWAWKLGRFADIDVYVHATFALIIIFVAGAHWAEGDSLAEAAGALLFVAALFACVVFHEYGHALAARRYGIKTRDITLYPIGGVARLERLPDKPMQELWVALAGPAVNVVIMLVLCAWLLLWQGFEPVSSLGIATGPFAERLLVANFFLVVFNLLPAFPMDGGRVLRALLALRLEYTRATNIAASIGQGLALLFGLFGVLGNPMLIFVAFFVWIGAAQEASMVQMRSSLAGIPVSRAMITDFTVLSPLDPLSRASQLIISGSQQDFPVLNGDSLEGILRRSDVLQALMANPPETAVGTVMHRDFITVDAAEMLEPIFARLQECDCHTVPVFSRGELTGMLTAENIGEFLMLQAAMGQRIRTFKQTKI